MPNLTKCLICGEMVYEIYHKGVKKLATIESVKYHNHEGLLKILTLHTCDIGQEGECHKN